MKKDWSPLGTSSVKPETSPTTFEASAADTGGEHQLSRRRLLTGGMVGGVVALESLWRHPETSQAAITPPPTNTAVFYPEDYAGISDPDNTIGIQGAIDAAAAAGGGTVQFGPKIYQCNGSLQTASNHYSLIMLPNTGSQMTIRLQGVPDKTVLATNVNLSGVAYSSVNGCPSFIGGPTPERMGLNNFSQATIEVKDLDIKIVNVPPTLGALDLSRHVRCVVENVYLRATPSSGDFADPSNKFWAFGLRLPDAQNYGRAIVDKVDIYGFYVGIICNTSHTHIRQVLMKWCFVGLGLQGSRIFYNNNDPHGTIVDHLITEWCTEHIIGWYPTSPPGGGNPGANWLWGLEPFHLTITHWDIEDAPANKWYSTFTHVGDGYTSIKGEVRFIKVQAGNQNGTADTGDVLHPGVSPYPTLRRINMYTLASYT